MPTQDTALTRPSHYGGEDNPFEPIKIIEHYDLGFHLGNTLKYMLRAGRKNAETELADLEKGLWYLQRKVDALKAARVLASAGLGDRKHKDGRGLKELRSGDRVRVLKEYKVHDEVVLAVGSIITVLDVDHTPGKEGVKFQKDGGVGWLSLLDVMMIDIEAVTDDPKTVQDTGPAL